MTGSPLTLCEELLLVTIDDVKGAITSSVLDVLPYGLAGAVLAELALHGKIQLDDRKLVIIDDSLLNQPLLDEIVLFLAQSKSPHKTAYWINKLAEWKLHKQALRSLVERGVLRQEEKRYLWVIPYDVYPQQDASAKYWLKTGLRAVVMAGEKAEPRTLILLSLLKACRMLNLVFTKDERKAAEFQIESLVKDEAFGEAVARTLDDIETAASYALLLMGA